MSSSGNGFNATDVETLAQLLHESTREAVVSGMVVNRVPNQPFFPWDQLRDKAREGCRVQARFLLKKGLVYMRALRAHEEEAPPAAGTDLY